jgi:hypothetical protein
LYKGVCDSSLLAPLNLIGTNSSMVEQRTCKPKVCGSIPSSDFSNITLRKHGRLDIDTNVCVCFLYVLWTYQRYSEENYNSIWLNGHWMRGNRESKMNIIFIYHLNIHILFLNLTFTCNERRRFSRVTIRPPLLYWPREKNGPEWYGLDNVVNLLVWSHFHSTKPLLYMALQFTIFLLFYLCFIYS